MMTCYDLSKLRQKLSAAISRSEYAVHLNAVMNRAEGYLLLDAPDEESLELEDGLMSKDLREVVRQVQEAKDRRADRALVGLEIGMSRFGGLPDLPACLEWPTLEGKKIPFLAQIDFISMPRWEGSPLPQTGQLYVFHLKSNERLGEVPVVIYEPSGLGELSRASMPMPDAIWQDWTGTSVYDAIPLVGRVGLTVDCVQVARDIDQDPAIFGSNLWCKVKYKANAEEPVQPGSQPAGYMLGDTSPEFGFANDYAEWAKEEGNDWMNLMTLGSIGSMRWSDGGSNLVLIRRKDLIASDFKKLTCGTGPWPQ